MPSGQSTWPGLEATWAISSIWSRLYTSNYLLHVHYSHLPNDHLTELLWGWSELMCAGSLAHCLGHSKYSIYILSYYLIVNMACRWHMKAAHDVSVTLALSSKYKGWINNSALFWNLKWYQQHMYFILVWHMTHIWENAKTLKYIM